jgi:glycosyltransferase involved in cell wall biosynthesis
MPKILSVVIPTYNMESYLSRCLDSVLLDELLDKIEIIIVNDGSTDNSLSVAKSYKEKYPESVVLIDKPNGHYGSCVNAALKIASGKYFRILDADDCFDSNVFIRFVAFLHTGNADMVISNFSRDYVSGGRKIAAKHASETYINQLFFMHGVSYQTRILHEVNYKQLEGICYTDTEYCFYPLAAIRSRAFFDGVLYRYTIGREGQTVNDEVYYKNREHAYRIIKRMIDYLRKQNTVTNENRTLQYTKLIQTVYYYFFSILTHSKNAGDEEKMRKIDDSIRKLNQDAYYELEAQKALRVLSPIKLWRKKSIYVGTTKRYMIMMLLQKIYCSLLRKQTS